MVNGLKRRAGETGSRRNTALSLLRSPVSPKLRFDASGQSTTEFILMLAILTSIGVFLMRTMDGGASGNTGAIHNIALNGTQKIQADED